MGKLYACLNVYQEEHLLPDCLRSVRENLPEAEIILIDGAYESWILQVKVQAAMEYAEGHVELAESMLRFVSPISTDATIQIAKDFKVEHIVMPQTQCMCGGKKTPTGYYEKGAYLPWPSEWQKRARFFDFGRNGDYYFIVDADERLRGKPAPLVADHYAVVLKRDDDISPYPVHRVFKHRPGIKMEGAHMAVWANELVQDPATKADVIKPVLMRKDEAPILQGCHFDHLFVGRYKADQVRTQAKGAYYRRGLSKEEEKFRAEHDI